MEGRAEQQKAPEGSTTTTYSAQRELHDHPLLVLFPRYIHFSPGFEAPESRDNHQFFPHTLYLGLPAQHTEPEG